MEGLVRDIVSAKFDVSKPQINAKVLTKRLRDDIKAVRKSYPTADMKTPLYSPRYVYLRVSIQEWLIWLFGLCAASAYQIVTLSCNVFKNRGIERPLLADLQTKMVLLMNATEEGVMLLHVSFSPSTNKQYSPLINVGSGFGLATPASTLLPHCL